MIFKASRWSEKPGNHIFRTVVNCKALGSHLISEETTLYYQDAPVIPQNSSIHAQNRNLR